MFIGAFFGFKEFDKISRMWKQIQCKKCLKYLLSKCDTAKATKDRIASDMVLKDITAHKS